MVFGNKQKFSLKWRQSASSGLQMEQEKGSPDVNTGSYKKINASCVEKNIDDTAPREEVQDIIFLTSDSIKDLTECPEQQRVHKVETVINNNNHEYADIPKNTVENRTLEIVEDNSQPDVVKPTDDHKEEVPLLAVPKSSTLQAEVSPKKDELKSISPLNGSTSIIQVERLKPRLLLPQESLWEKLRPKLVICLQPESPLMTFISQYEECNSTSESITNIFEIDVPGRATSKEDSLLEERTETNDAMKNNLPARTKEANQLIERLQDLKLDRNWDELMSYACSCLHSLITALTDEGIQLEQAASVNEAVGVQLLATAPKSARLSRHAADVGRVTALIAGLATRLARATNPLKLAVHSPERRRMLMAKQEKLADQLEEAKKLKENIDSRGSSLFDSLSAQVSEEFKGQYSQFIATKVKLTVYARDVQDRLDLAKQLLDGFQLDNRLVSDSAVAKHVSLVAAKEDGAVFK